MKNMLLMLFVFSALMGFGGEDIHEDVVVWLRGDSDINGDGVIQNGEIVDSLSLIPSAEIEPYGWLDGTVAGMPGDFRWTNDTIVVPYTRRTIPDAKSYHFRQSVYAANSGSMPNTIRMPSVASKITSASWSFHVRFKWSGDFISPKSTQQYIVRAAVDSTASAGHGFQFAIDTSGHFVSWIGDIAFMSYNTNVTTIDSNKWTDVIFVFNEGGKVNLSVMQEGGTLIQKSMTPGDTKYRPKPDGVFTLGNNNNLSDWQYYRDSALAFNAFRGQINQFAVWNKALTADEVKRVLAWPCEDLLRAGIANGNSDEFDDGQEISMEPLNPDNGWGAFGGSIAAGASKSIVIGVTNRFHDLPQLLRWRGASDSARGSLQLSVNGTTLETKEVGPGAWTFFSIPGSYFVDGATTTLTLMRTDNGSNPLKTDAIAVGGSWQTGKIGPVNQETWEYKYYANPPSDFFVPDSDWQHLPDRFVTGFGMNWKFDMPAGIAGHYKYVLKLKSNFEKSATGHKFVAYVNGTKVCEEKRDYGAWYSREFKIPANVFKAGTNVLRIANEGSGQTDASSYIAIDYVQLVVDKPARGMVLVFK